MLKQERHQAILETLGREGKILASELSRRFGVSEDTVRRDLRTLTREGKLQRVHGGALPHSPAEISYNQRIRLEPEGKESIARAAIPLISDGQIILLDGGTTTLQIARLLPPGLKITVITNSIPIADLLSEHPTVDVVLLGGRVFAFSRVTVGNMTCEALQTIHADLLFLGVCSLHPRTGISVTDMEESYVKKAMIANSRIVAALATTDKLGTAASYIVAPLSAISHLIIDADPHDAQLAPYRRAGISILGSR